ncbi:unnamed protein product [Clavelina lepadiformis]|uniref:Uncharacterized protein n=1 Tax=Clavelina lepadiformis TaxID=159417 RepID=A0ABP0G373_CLALP
MAVKLTFVNVTSNFQELVQYLQEICNRHEELDLGLKIATAWVKFEESKLRRFRSRKIKKGSRLVKKSKRFLFGVVTFQKPPRFHICKKSVSSLWNKLHRSRGPTRVISGNSVLFQSNVPQNISTEKLRLPLVSAFVKHSSNVERLPSDSNKSENGKHVIWSENDKSFSLVPLLRDAPSFVVEDNDILHRNFLCLPSSERYKLTEKQDFQQGMTPQYSPSSARGCHENNVQDLDTFDEGCYHNKQFRQCHQELVSPSKLVNNTRELLCEMKKYNDMKNLELPAKLQAAKAQVKVELQLVKKGFQLPKENVEFTSSQIYDCPAIKVRQQLITNVNSQINQLEREIEVSKQTSNGLEKMYSDKSSVRARKYTYHFRRS